MLTVQEPKTTDHVQTRINSTQAPAPLSDRIHSALSTNPYVPSRQVHIEAANGRVVLKGNVGSFFQKQMAQEAIRRIDGVQLIDNLLEVTWA
jgi:osmotically-inducible protein OsmY